MRIISENRMVDVPYDEYTIAVHDEHIIALKENADNAFRLAHPETPKQARRAMEAIQEAYLSGAKIVYMDFVMEEVREE